MANIAPDANSVTLMGWSKTKQRWVNIGATTIAGDLSMGVLTSSVFLPDDYEALTFGSVAEPLDFLFLDNYFVTPNGDGIHDEIEIRYALFGLPESVPVELRVHRMDGALLVTLPQGEQMAGLHTVRWDGRDEAGRLAQPGMYLVSVSVLAEQRNDLSIRPVGVAY